MTLSYRYLIDPEDTKDALKPFLNQKVIGLDTETYRDPESGGCRLSLLQIASSSGELLVIDAFAAGISEARRLIEDSSIVKVAHNAKFDHYSLGTEGFSPRGLLDTLRLSRRALNTERFSLAVVAKHLLGITLDKSLQRSDWFRRPLDRAQLDYAALDARVVLDVYKVLAEKLTEEGRFDEEHERAMIDRQEEVEPGCDSAEPPRSSRPITARERKLEKRRGSALILG